MVGIGYHRQLRHSANTGGLLGKFAEGDQRNIRRGQHLQGRDRAAKNANLKIEIGGNARREGIKHRGGVITG